MRIALGIVLLLLVIGCGDDDKGGPVPDVVPPGTVSDLTVNSMTGSSVTLVWTAPGDDGMSGTARQYDIRYSTTPLTEGGWPNATPIASPPVPKIAGSGEVAVVGGLPAETAFYFSLRAADEVPNWSGVSNVVSETTVLES